MIYYIGIGSNEGDRLQNLTLALTHLKQNLQVLDISPLMESPPLLPEGFPESWYAPFLNAALKVEWNNSPTELLKKIKTIEHICGRQPKERWAPRVIDLDILASENDEAFHSPELTLPHTQVTQRDFALAPLVHLNSQLRIQNQSVKKHLQQLPQSSPYLMGIVNCTPDSFSHSSSESPALEQFKHLLKLTTPWIDLGAESTRPEATPITSSEEIERLKPLFEFWKDQQKKHPWTHVSIDTRHPETAAYALENGATLLNDVSHLSNPALKEIARHYKHVVFMHSLTVPASKTVNIPHNQPVLETLYKWCENKLNELSDFSLDQLIFDPGIGFNKTAVQSLRILQNIDFFSSLPVRLLMGSSRKSFMNLWSHSPYAERDPETLGVSLFLQQKPIHILRVHNVELHQRALLSQQCLTHPL